MVLNAHLLLLLLIPCIGASSSAESMADSENLAKKNSSTTVVIRRKSPSRASVGGNRFSLMNSRFNRRPKKKNLDREHLLEILGDFYDPNWMSIDEPESLKHEDKGTTYIVRKDAWPYQELKKALEILDLSADVNSTKIDKDDVEASKALASIMEKWLLKKASCPVKYAWEDIGNMFWPRWVKRGECATVPGTCSWPPGMHCVESNRSNLHILRWQCRAPKSKGIGGRRRQQPKFVDKKDSWNRRFDNEPVLLRCQWIRVPYPITSACHCTC